MTTKPTKATAREKLERSKLSDKSVQNELMGDDLDLANMLIYLKSKIKFDAIERITEIMIYRTIEGASTVVITLMDPKREVLRSGLLNSRLDIQLDGLWFRLVKVEKKDDKLDLTFEDREVAILRTYNDKKIVHRSKATRAEFVNNLIREVKEFHIPVVIPDLHKVQPIEKEKDISSWADQSVAKTGGIPEDIANAQDLHRHGENTPTTAQRPRLMVKTLSASLEQIRNANIVLATGDSMGASRKALVCSIMTIIQESTMINVTHGDTAGPDSLGLFQQRASWGTAEARLDPATAARMFFNRAMSEDAADRTRPYWDLCAAVQRPRADLRPAYEQWRSQGEDFVSAYGIPGGDTAGSAASVNLSKASGVPGADYIFYRGLPINGGKNWKKEDSWACQQRLASEVQWRAFFVSGVFYFIDEDSLFKSRPLATITEFSQGIEAVDGDYDTGKNNAQLTIKARVGTWLVPPGAVIVLQDMGPWNGRWLVANFERSAFSSDATIILKKPLPKLPEPLRNDINTIPSWAEAPAATDPSVYGQTGNFTNPLPTKMTPTSEFLTPDTEGAPARSGVRYHAGKDWFAPGNTPVVAPISGTIVEAKQSSGNVGQIFGGVVKLQQDDGYVWVFRHVQPAAVIRVGSRVQPGDTIAGVVLWADKPSSSHAHIEIWRTLAGGYFFENMIDPVLYIQGRSG